jgi:hypothetical protein
MAPRSEFAGEFRSRADGRVLTLMLGKTEEVTLAANEQAARHSHRRGDHMFTQMILRQNLEVIFNSHHKNDSILAGCIEFITGHQG